MQFPFQDRFQFGMGIRPIMEKEPIMVCDHHYMEEIGLKRSLLNQEHTYYFQSNEGTKLAQWEVVELILMSLAAHYPNDFQLSMAGDHWTWWNILLDEKVNFILNDLETLPSAPLDWVGRQVQEDLLLVDDKSFLVAGQLCFPSGWALEEKMGKSFLDMHSPLPGVLDPMLAKAEQLMGRILVGKSLQRSNWGLRLNNQLDLSTKYASEYARLLEQSDLLSPKELLEMVYVRIEHQTLTRLPLSRNVLFTVHTHVEQLNVLMDTREKIMQTHSYLKSVPKEVLEYKLVWPFYGKLMEGLEKIL